MILAKRVIPSFIDVFARNSAIPTLFANGRELDPKTAMAVMDLSPHLLKDIGVTDNDLPGKRVDKPLRP